MGSWTRDRHPGAAGLVALAAASSIGVFVALAPGWAWLMLLLLCAGVAVVLVPAWTLLPGAVVIGAGTALVMVEIPSAIGMVGHGRSATLLLGLALAKVVTHRVELRIPRLTAVVAGLYAGSVLLMALVALFSGRVATETQSDVQRELSLTLAPLLVGLTAFSTEADRARALRSFGIVTLVLALLALLYWAWDSALLAPIPDAVQFVFEQARGRSGMTAYSGRVVFPFTDTDPNSAAAIFAILAAFCFGPLMALARPMDRVLAVLVAIVSIGAIIATQSRMGIIMILAIIATYAALSALSGRARAVSAVSALALALATLGIVTVVFPSDRQVTLDDDNVRSRIAVYEQTLDDIAASPLYGHGLRYGAQGRYFEGVPAHNEYLERFVDGGIVGGGVFLAVLGTFGAMAIVARRQGGLEAAIGTGSLATLGALLISMTAVNSWTSAPFLELISWLVFGVISATYARLAAEQAPRSQFDPV